MIPLPGLNSVILWAVIFSAGALSGGWAAREWERGVVARRDLKVVQDNARVQILRADRADQAADRHEKVKTQIEYVYAPIRTEVERVKIEYRDLACLDDDGLRVAGRAIAAANAAAGIPARAVSGAAGSD